jgi:hypothetical protein
VAITLTLRSCLIRGIGDVGDAARLIYLGAEERVQRILVARGPFRLGR